MSTTSESFTVELPLIVGHIYEAKRPSSVGGVFRLVNDREIVWIGDGEVQYDSPSLPTGRRLPRVSFADFRRWAGRDITGEMPSDGNWRSASALRGDRNAA